MIATFGAVRASLVLSIAVLVFAACGDDGPKGRDASTDAKGPDAPGVRDGNTNDGPPHSPDVATPDATHGRNDRPPTDAPDYEVIDAPAVEPGADASIDGPTDKPSGIELGTDSPDGGEARLDGPEEIDTRTDTPDDPGPRIDVPEEIDGPEPAENCGSRSYQFIKDSLRPWNMPTAAGTTVPVLLVPLMNPSADASHPVAFKDVYHLFPAAVVVPLLVEAGDLDTAARVLEFYFQLYENKTGHPELWNGARFDGFPEIYKDLSGAENLTGDIHPDPGNDPDSGVSARQVRGMGPNSWLANAVIYYYEALRKRGAQGDAAQMERARRVAEALASWLGYLQDDGLDAWLQSQQKTRMDVPWLDGGIAGTIDEKTRAVSSGPYTEGSAAAYAVFRKLQILEERLGDTAKATAYGNRAHRLGLWFRYVIDGVTGRVFVGRRLDGGLVEGVPSIIAEAVDTYAFLIMAGVPDSGLAGLLIDRVRSSCVYRSITDREGRTVQGLAFGPQGKNAVFWGPHGQVDLAARLVKHPLESTLLSDMRAGSYDCRLTTFAPDGTLGANDKIDDWTGSPSESAWVGWRGQFALEPTAWLAMRDKLGEGFNILGPVTWTSEVKQGDTLLGDGANLVVACSDSCANGGCGEDSPSPQYADKATSSPFTSDAPYLSWQLSSETCGGRAILHLDLSQAEAGASDEHIMVFRYAATERRFDDTYTFYMNAAMTITLVEFEFKSVTGNAKRFRIPVMPSRCYAKVTLDLRKYLSATDLEQVNEVLLHLSGQGRLKLDGFLK